MNIIDNNFLFRYKEKKNLQIENNLIEFVKKDWKRIKKIYEIIYEYNEIGIKIDTDGEWLLDNLYIIEKEVFSCIDALANIDIYELPSENENIRIYNIANQIVNVFDGVINKENVKKFLLEYSKIDYLKIKEIWTLSIMLKISLIKYIREISEKTLYRHEQKYKVESIIERIIENKKYGERKYKKKIRKKEKNQINKPFIEYMAYRLRQLETEGIEYIEIFDEEVLKLGVTVDNVVSKEHFNIVTNQNSIGNSILSLKNVNSIDFSTEFEEINEIDVILSKENVNIYSKMDYETLEMYKKEICNISKDTGIAEKYICDKIINLCNENVGIKAHCGYYILDDGKGELYKELSIKKKFDKKKENENKNLGIYLAYIIGGSFFITMIFSFLGLKNESILLPIVYIFLMIIITAIPISQVLILTIDKFLLKTIKPKKLPSLDFSKKIPDTEKTFVIIPTLLNSTKRVEELIRNLEMYYLLNKQDNIFFALLGDCSEIDEKHIDLDNQIIEIGTKKIKELNEKYKFNIPKFYFLYRDRVYNKGQKKYLGWERKRGLITQFNRFLLYDEKGQFNTNNINREKLGEIKYVLTIDADTQIGFNSVSKLAGTMAHILNKPVLNKENTRVISGYGILQPRIGVNIECANKNIFSAVYAGYGGTDIYTNAISDIYQDVWGEGSFTGKGIYDLEVFSTVLDKQIPTNTVLSHDLLEGSHIRCGLITDVEFIDGYPSRYNNYIVRQNRWLRGDIQIIDWIKDKIKNGNKKIKNPLNKLSRWKILDNIRRGLLDICLFFNILLGISILNIKWYYILSFIVFMYMYQFVLEYILTFQNNKYNKNYIKILGNFERNVYRTILEIAFLPYKAITNIDTFIRTKYRMRISKKYLLEWLTAEQAEKVLGKDLKTYINEMYISGIIGIILIVLTNIFSSNIGNIIFSYVIGILWISAPIIAWYISKDKKRKKVLNTKDEMFLKEVAKDTWQYFSNYINEKNNYLIPDNYQENRENEIAERTSCTNIGLSFISIITASDLKFINDDISKKMIKNILDTVDKLEKYKGNLYNWYNIKTLQPLDYKVSSVDTGNYIAYLYVLKSFCKECLKDIELQERVSRLIENTDLTFLFDKEKQLFSIEYNVQTGELSKSYYDLLASESRILSFVAIAKGDVSYKHWYKLSRSLTSNYGYKGLISWTGTSFEYFMPYGLMKSYKYSLLDETYKFVTLNQVKYVKNKKIPWGISESAFNLYDTKYNYQYKAFGVPKLGLKRDLENDLVISPYASIIVLPKYPEIVIKNMIELKKRKIYGKYGYYEAIDYTNSRNNNKDGSLVKTFMAHHQGLILMAINNQLNSQILQKRFRDNPEINAIDILLQEKIRDVFVINNKIKKESYKEKEETVETELYNKKIENNNKEKEYNVISNNDYVIVMDENGNGYSRFKEIYPYRYNIYENKNGIQIYAKHEQTEDVIDLYRNSDVIFTQYDNTYINKKENIEYETKVGCLYDGKGESRNIKIKNYSDKEQQISLFFYLEPIISNIKKDISHRAYNNMFLEYTKEDNGIIVHRRKGNDDEKIYLYSRICSDNSENITVEFENDRYKFLGRNKTILNSNVIKKGIILGNNVNPTVEPIIAYKVLINIKPEQVINIAYLQGIAKNIEEAKGYLLKYNDYAKTKNNTQLLLGKSIIENKFYKYSNEDISNYNILIKYFVEVNRKRVIYDEERSKNCKQSNLWKKGISGDDNILYIIINRKIENILVKQILNYFIYLKTKGINLNLVINVNCQEKYIREIYDEIIELLHMLSISYELNNNIFVIQNKDLDEGMKNTLDVISALKLNGKNGVLKNQIKIIENLDKSSTNKQNGNIENIADNININNDELEYFNDIGGFVRKTGEYKIILKNNYTTPAPWSNVLANENFGTVVNENGGGFTWNKNSNQNKLTVWKNDPVLDFPSEYITLEEDGKIWSTTLLPYNVKDATYIITHGFGYTSYETSVNNIYTTQYVFVPKNENIKICLCKIKNKSNINRKIGVSNNVEILLGDNVINNIYYIQEEKENIYIKEIYKNVEFDEIMYLSTSVDKIVDNIQNTLEEYSNLIGKQTVFVDIEANEEISIAFFIGQEKCKDDILKTINKYNNFSNIYKALEQVKEKWEEINSVIEILTPVESMNLLVNKWLLYQTLASRLEARTGYYQNGGAFGFRDQLQDTIGIMLINKDFAKKQILYHASHQYLEGDVQHWWHREKNVGIRARYTDDLLWLPYIVLEYMKITGDNYILEDEVNYVESNILQEYEKDRYEIPNVSNIKESVYLHIIRAIDKSLEMGQNNLPYIGGGDWNDGFNNIYGQSVWLGFFLYDILNKFLPFVKQEEKKKEYKEVIKKLENGLANSWDGKWYKRAYFKDGKELGTINNEECKIDSISQSWAIISNFNIHREKNIFALESVDNMLVDRDNKIIKLFTPSLDKSNLFPGYVKEYLPGIRENGGQYTHAAVWLIMAHCIIGNGNIAEEYFRMLNPIEHSKTNESSRKYKVEPYVVAADVYSAKGMEGRGGWTWYTGSSSWLYKIAIEYILGLKVYGGNRLKIEPCINSEWKKYEIWYKYRNTKYHINVINNNAKQNGVEKILLDGKEIYEKTINLIDDRSDHEIQVIM